MEIPIALQLYSVRDKTEKDFLGTLEKVAAIGYAGVEFAGYGGLTSRELASALARLKLQAAGSHVAWELLRDGLDGAIDFCSELGCRRIVCPWAPISDQASVDTFAALLDAWGEKIQRRGLELHYHNHDHEFARVGGKYALDLLLARTDPAFLKMEFDTCWVQAGGADPAAYVRTYAGRCPLIHIKDMKAGGGKVLTEVGNGVVDIPAILREAVKAGVEWLIIEQDTGERPTLESAGISYRNLARIRKG